MTAAKDHAMTIDEMRHCVAEVIRLGNATRELNELDQRAAARAAPPQSELARFAAEVGDAVPPSLLTLLSLHDGVDCFDYVDVDLYPMAYLLAHGRALEEEWVDAGKAEAGELYVFGRSDSDSLAVAFLRRERAADGEMPVVMIDARGELARYGSLADYLQSRRDWFQEQVDLEQADRAALRDDE
jgi:hypothetical protein